MMGGGLGSGMRVWNVDGFAGWVGAGLARQAWTCELVLCAVWLEVLGSGFGKVLRCT